MLETDGMLIMKEPTDVLAIETVGLVKTFGKVRALD
jgi:hypothetical protein